MKPFDINQLKTFKDEYPLSYLAVFGSYARGEQTEGSDLDLLVRYSEPVSLFDVVGMQREMSEKLGIEVDLVSEGALSSKIKPYVTPDLQVVFDEK